MVYGKRIRTLRVQCSLSQGALGKLIDKDGQYVSKLERGVLTSVTTETLERLADALRCSTDYLLGREDAIG
jgi:transcriptional regulator with XRE-family HTH domain